MDSKYGVYIVLIVAIVGLVAIFTLILHNNLSIQKIDNSGQAILTTAQPINVDGSSDIVKSERYIILLNEQPLSSVYNTVSSSSIVKSNFDSQKNKIINEQTNALNSMQQLLNHKIEKKITFSTVLNGFVVQLTEEEANTLRTSGLVKGVEKDGIFKFSMFNSIPQIHANEVWNIILPDRSNITGRGVKIAIIDSGIDFSHSALGGCLGNPNCPNTGGIPGACFGQGCKVEGGCSISGGNCSTISPSDYPMDYFGHGTAVASIAAGVAPGAKLYAYQVMLYDNLQQSTYDSNVIRAIDVALDPNQDGNLSDHVDIISLSGGDRNGNPYDALSTAANNAVDAGAVFVVAAGNYGGEYIPSPNSKYTGPNYGTISSPGCAEKVITVGSVDQNDHISFFSSRGPIAGVTYTKPDIVAPGQGNKPSCANYCPPNSGLCVAKSNIFNMNYIIDCPNHPGYFTGFGTSFSTPHVSGVAALLLQKNPNWTPAQVKEAIKKTAIHLQNYSVNDQGSGRVDALAAIKLCNDMTPNAQCSVSKPNYCNSGVLINNCKTCGCPNLYSCTSTGSCTKSIVSVQATSK